MDLFDRLAPVLLAVMIAAGLVAGGFAAYDYLTAEEVTESVIVYSKDVVCKWDEDDSLTDCTYLIETSAGTFAVTGWSASSKWQRVITNKPATITYKDTRATRYRHVTDIRQETP